MIAQLQLVTLVFALACRSTAFRSERPQSLAKKSPSVTNARMFRVPRIGIGNRDPAETIAAPLPSHGCCWSPPT
jgi:hypothetical protein